MCKDDVLKFIEEEAQSQIEKMSPLQMGKLIHPNGVAISFAKIPNEVVLEHLQRYTKDELKRGQFFKVGEKFTFFMDKIAYQNRRKIQH